MSNLEDFATSQVERKSSPASTDRVPVIDMSEGSSSRVKYARVSDLPNGDSFVDPEAARSSLGTTPQRKYLLGPDTAFRAFRGQLDMGFDAAIGFIGDSTFVPADALPVQFADALAERYPNAQIELRRAAQTDPWGITTTIVQAGADGRRYRYFGTGATYGLQMPATMLRETITGATKISFETEVALDAPLLTNGVPSTEVSMMGIGSAGACTNFYLASNGYLVLRVEVSSGVSINAVSAIPLPNGTFTAGVPLKLRVDFDADNGANRVATFYTAPAGSEAWVQFSTPITSTVTTIYTGEQFFWMGSPGLTATDGVKFYHAQLLLGTKRDPVFPYRIDMWTYGNGQVTGLSTIGGSQTIYLDDFSQNGASIAANGFFSGSGAGDFPTEAYRSYRDHAPTLIILNTGHNDFGMSAVARETNLDAAVTAILARSAYGPLIVHTTQNPEPADLGQGLSYHFNRSQTETVCYSYKKGRCCIGVHFAFEDQDNPDDLIPGNVHPSESGNDLWFRVTWDCFLSGSNETFTVIL